MPPGRLPPSILKVTDYGEADRLVVFLTPARGPLTGMAKHARQSRRRFAHCLEPLQQGDPVPLRPRLRRTGVHPTRGVGPDLSLAAPGLGSSGSCGGAGRSGRQAGQPPRGHRGDLRHPGVGPGAVGGRRASRVPGLPLPGAPVAVGRVRAGLPEMPPVRPGTDAPAPFQCAPGRGRLRRLPRVPGEGGLFCPSTLGPGSSCAWPRNSPGKSSPACAFPGRNSGRAWPSCTIFCATTWGGS